MIIVRRWIFDVLKVESPKPEQYESLVSQFRARMGLVIVANAPCCMHCDNLLSLLRIDHPSSTKASLAVESWNNSAKVAFESLVNAEPRPSSAAAASAAVSSLPSGSSQLSDLSAAALSSPNLAAAKAAILASTEGASTENKGLYGWWNPLTDVVIGNSDTAFNLPIPWHPTNKAR